MKIISVVGTRPNVMKVAPLHKAFANHNNVIHLICHTGQHYDEKMSKVFFDDLEMPKPDFYLGVGSGSHAEQTAKIMIKFEKILLEEKPDLIIVAGDVNSTIACGLTTKKLNIKVAHIEAGLRSFDMGMPEEINRILTDRISDYLFVSGIPCITVRNNTECPVTIEVGTNILSGTNLNVVEENVRRLILDEKKKGRIPELWDGKTASRIINVLNNN
ncbi:MAG: UDP-N-acetyl glucosamine 2-epimerase [Syntrophothermus sp.]